MTETISSGRLVFPSGPADGDVHIHNGVEYTFKDNRWVVVPKDALDDLGDRYVKVPGDTMSGALHCPMFSGNYDVEGLRDLP